MFYNPTYIYRSEISRTNNLSNGEVRIVFAGKELYDHQKLKVCYFFWILRNCSYCYICICTIKLPHNIYLTILWGKMFFYFLFIAKWHVCINRPSWEFALSMSLSQCECPVYRITCQLCNERYIGESFRTVHDRLWSEHLRFANNPTAPSYMDEAMAVHYRQKHSGDRDNLKCELITTECNTVGT